MNVPIDGRALHPAVRPGVESGADPGADARADWLRRPERSNMFWLRVMTWISLRLGRGFGRLVLRLIAAYFLVFSPAARRVSRAYLRRALARPPTWLDCYRHFLSFASTIHDRVYLVNDRYDLFDVSVVGDDVMTEALARGKGVLLLGAHMGSFEVLRAIGRRHGGLRVVMVMFEENAQKINRTLAAINPKAQPDIIPLGRVDSMLAVRDRLAEGAVVGGFDADQDQPRHRAVAQLVDQHLLLARRRLRQECGEISGELCARDDQRAAGHCGEPDRNGNTLRAGHDAGALSARPVFWMFISERSPSACRISIDVTSPRLPPMRIVCTSCAMRGSLGVSVSIHCAASPSSDSP